MPTVIKKKMINGVASFLQYWRGNPVVDYNPGGSPVPPTPGPGKTMPFHIKRHNENVTTDVNIKCGSTPNAITVEQSTDGVNWTTLGTTGAGVTLNIPVPASTGVYLRAIVDRWNTGGYNLEHEDSHICLISGSGSVDLEGNIMSLMYGSNFTGNEIYWPDFGYHNYTFHAFFNGAPIDSSLGVLNVVDASGLILPVTILDDGCYSSMFEGCTSLVNPPHFPINATTPLATAMFCCCRMFKDCTSLTSAPVLPFNYRSGDFSSSGTADYCYQSMFEGCTSLTTAPYLPALYVGDNSYASMFKGCTSLTTVPNLPATSIYNNAYNDMFNGCTSLVVAPEIAATTLAYNCCNGMFALCTSITTPPSILPATTLAGQCYMSMFNYCTSLTYTPKLPAHVLEGNCYRWMFQNCTSLTKVTCDAIDISADWCTGQWLDNVAASGVFLKNPANTSWTTGGDGIPSGWNVVDNLFYLTNDDVNPVTVSITKYVDTPSRDANDAPTISLEISDDGTSWTTLGNTSSTALSFTIPVGGRKYLRSISANAWGDNGLYGNYFSSTGSFGAHGDIMALLGYDTLKGYDCRYMFLKCTGLTTAPSLPATTLAESCYGCMFDRCTSLTAAPTLPATTLAHGCYYYMFCGCTGLTETPVLRATTLDQNSYGYMFYKCTSLNKVICNATNISAYNCTWNWLDNVASSGTFYKNPSMSSWTTGDDGIPSGWTVQDISQ